MSRLSTPAFSPHKLCAFDEIPFRPRKLIGDERGSDYQLAFVCDFYFELSLEIKIA